MILASSGSVNLGVNEPHQGWIENHERGEECCSRNVKMSRRRHHSSSTWGFCQMESRLIPDYVIGPGLRSMTLVGSSGNNICPPIRVANAMMVSVGLQPEDVGKSDPSAT